MATRFGAVSPAQAFATKVRWLVACLVLVILTLVGTIVALVQSSDSPQVQLGDPSPVSASVSGPASPMVDVLVANTRIEEGMILNEAMIGTQAVHPDRVPQDAIRAENKMQVVGKYAATLIRPGLPLLQEDVTATPPVSLLNIPPGFRAVTILVNRQSGVEGWARPGSRVDVLWTYKDGAETKVATIVRFTKILSVEGAASSDPNAQKAAVGKDTTVTLLLAEKDAKKVELARSVGTLSLALVGETVAEGPKDISPDVVTIGSILGTEDQLKAGDEPVQGKMYAKDPRTGRQVLYVLKNGNWVLDSEANQQ